MTDLDFAAYYVEPLRLLRCDEYWDLYSFFPHEASLEDRQKSLNALYRFYVSGIMHFKELAKEDPMGAFELLEKAPLAKIDEGKYFDAWLAILVKGSKEFINSEASALGLPLEKEAPHAPNFRENLEALFQKHGVGFEKGSVYPPQN
ncbi:hypothetical protein FAI40_04360 [Acetobacteraceae bacterium]|nr:hypothetical protein FAI40_04360 [Acetobacteraceae bacterium]